jgi:hypothetical protein
MSHFKITESAGSDAESFEPVEETKGVVVPFEKPVKDFELNPEQQRNLQEILDGGYENRENAYIELARMRIRRDKLEAVSVRNITESFKNKIGKWFYETEEVPIGDPNNPQVQNELAKLNSEIDRLGWLLKNSGRVFSEKERERFKEIALFLEEEESSGKSIAKAA